VKGVSRSRLRSIASTQRHQRSRAGSSCSRPRGSVGIRDGTLVSLTPEGLRFSNAHFPILTTPLAILGDCEFEFQGRIDSKQIGWALSGTKSLTELLPSFCVMFAVNTRGELTPHVWNAKHPHPATHYHSFARTVLAPGVRPRPGEWTRVLTHVRASTYEVEIDGNAVFQADFSTGEFAPVFSQSRQGQVGFRCCPGEQATVRLVRVRALG